MIILLDSSTEVCRVSLIDADGEASYEWQAARGLADGLIAYLRGLLAKHAKTWQDISGIGVYQGPGSFTGLRIGLSVMNTLADGLDVPIVGTTGDAWKSDALRRIRASESDGLVLPLYGRAPNITTPRK